MSFVYSLLLNILTFAFAANIVNGVDLPKAVPYWLLTMVGIAIASLLHRPLLKFLTVKRNFVTYMVASAILVFVVLYFFEVFVPGLHFNVTVFKSVDLGILTINTFELSEILTMASFAVFGSVLSALLFVLKKAPTI